MNRLVLISFAFHLSTLTACASEPDVCGRARSLAAECTGVEPPPPPEGCVGAYAEAAERALEQGCDGVGNGKFDENSWYCQPDSLWLGLCVPEPLSQSSAVAELDTVCAGRTDALCEALRDESYVDAREAVRSAVAGDTNALTDPAVRYYVRERALALFAYRVLAGPVAGYADRADALLAEHFPAYPRGSIAMAREPIAPRPTRTCSAPTEALLIFPGVVRLTSRDEFSAFTAAARREMPCLEILRVETGSFVAPEVNATRAMQTIAALDARLGRAVPLHFLGYSQGAMNALRTLADNPTLATRVRTVLTMNSAAHGSEVADLLSRLLGDLGQDACSRWPAIFRPTCEWAASLGVIPSDGVLRAIAWAMGVPVDDLQRFIAAEDEISPAPDLRAFLIGHRPGVDSLTTHKADQFWATHGARLPKSTLYVSFRSVISKPDLNLPRSNGLFYALLGRVTPYRPWNDMQVRLENQSFGGPLSSVEVVGRVAEGNHWQWQLADGAVPPAVMDPDMTRRTPDVDMLLAHYQALQDAGFVLR